MRKRGHGSSGGAGGVALGMIITPMLDMSFQILAFFIMTYHPSALEGHINGNLVPPSKSAVKGKENNQVVDNLLPDSDPELEDTLQVTVKSVPKGESERKRVDGEPTMIYVKKKEDSDAGLVADSDEDLEVSLKKLREKLKGSLTGGAMKGNIRLDCEGDLKHQYVMRIYDVCKQAGFQNVSFVAPVAGTRKN